MPRIVPGTQIGAIGKSRSNCTIVVVRYLRQFHPRGVEKLALATPVRRRLIWKALT